jgi:uncharacterized protein (DUF1697 family)
MNYVALLRGINVGGKNKISMLELKYFLEDVGLSGLRTYINSGNVLFQSGLSRRELEKKIEVTIVSNFKLDSSIIKTLVLSEGELRRIIEDKPSGFGEHPDKYHSDVIFLMGLEVSDAIKVFQPKVGVDKIWPGDGVIYSQRVSALRTKSNLNKIIGTPEYQSMTIRNWNTTTKLLALAQNSV